MFRPLRTILLFSLVLTGHLLKAQVNDAGLWMSVCIEKKITPALSAFFTEEIRLNENITEAGTIFSDIGGKYQFGKRFQVGAAYRFTLKRRLDDSYEHRNSWYLDVRYREKIKPVSLILRLRYQSRYAEAYTSETAGIPKNHIRAKLTVKFDTDSKFEPYVYTETFFRLSVPAAESLDLVRWCAGVEYAFNRMHMIDLHYLIQKEMNVKNPVTDYVIGLSYQFSF